MASNPARIIAWDPENRRHVYVTDGDVVFTDETITYVGKRYDGTADVIIDGRCLSPIGVSDFVANLEASGYFKRSIEIVSTTSEPMPQPPGELIKFSIKAVFQQPGDAKTPAAPTAVGATQ
jgi:hypothetical protein